MIVGIGSDLCDVRRIAEVYARHGERFAGRILGAQELALFRRRHARLPERGMRYLATRFAAKEAFSKAIGLGMRMPMHWRGVQVLKAPSGQPQALPEGELAAWCAARGLRFHLSLSDEGDLALAVVVAECAAVPSPVSNA
jgi:holo-[acyl-carrier protein] synthase